jgi:small subunit ribosomal protein S2
MKRRPDLLFIVDVGREEAAVHEANLLNLPIVALVDTNCNPQNVDYVIPSNDDAIRAIKLLVAKVADAVLEGKAMRKDDELSEEKLAAEAMDLADRSTRRAPRVVETDEELEDTALLGQATLAKMNASREDEQVPAPPANVDVEETKTEEKNAE